MTSAVEEDNRRCWVDLAAGDGRDRGGRRGNMGVGMGERKCVTFDLLD